MANPKFPDFRENHSPNCVCANRVAVCLCCQPKLVHAMWAVVPCQCYVGLLYSLPIA